MLDISDAEFAALRDAIRERFGIYYDDQKRFLLLSRLQTRLAKRGFETYRAYVAYLRSDPRREEEWTDLASVLSNNETYFFRERAQLKALAGPVLDRAAGPLAAAAAVVGRLLVGRGSRTRWP